MAKIDDLWNTILAGVEHLALDTLKGYVNEAKEDVDYFWKQSNKKVGDLAEAYEEKKLSHDELADLVDDQLAIAEMFALTKIGIAKIRIDRFRVGLIDLIIGSISKVF